MDGNDRIVTRLTPLCARAGHVPHAFLFFGPSRDALERVAREFALGLLCMKHRYGGCGACAVCVEHERFAAPRDLKVVAPDEKGIISIETARDVATFLSRTPGLSLRKAVIVTDAHRLTEEAQNMLLKTIEEPPEDSVLMLLSVTPGALAETIRSRLVAVRFPGSTDMPVPSEQGDTARFDAALSGDNAEKLRVAGMLADDARLREHVLSHWIRTFSSLLAGTTDPTARQAIARNARIALSGSLLLARSEMNPRLVVENMVLSFRPHET